MFTFGILRNFIRERSSSWRHAGFIPKVAKAKTSCESLQLYHDCMAMILSTLQPIQDNPPLEWLQFGDEPPVQKELIIQAGIEGDGLAWNDAPPQAGWFMRCFVNICTCELSYICY